MKKILVFLILFSWTCLASAVEYRAYYLYTNLRIVIVDLECNIPNLKGQRASAQRMDRLYIQGCWYKMEKYPGMIHLDWSNGDWSELPYDKFEKIDTNN